MIKKLIMIGLAIVVMAFGTGCREEVGPGFKGKIMSGSGYSPEIKETGRYFMWPSEEIVLLETSTQNMEVPLEFKLKDDMTLKFSVNFRTRVNGSEPALNALFSDITPEIDDNKTKVIRLSNVYQVYGKDVVLNIARSVVTRYKIEELSANYDQVNKQLQEELRTAMKGGPLEVSNITLANVVWPTVITEAVEKQKERELALQTEANNQAIEMLKKTNELELANADKERKIIEARTITEQNEILSRGLSDKLLAYKSLDVQMKMAENERAVFVPYEAFGSSGLSNRVFQQPNK